MWCEGLNRDVYDCGEPCIGGTCLRVARRVDASATRSVGDVPAPLSEPAPVSAVPSLASISLRSEVERLSRLLASSQAENAKLGNRLARIIGCLRELGDEDALHAVRAELARE